MAHEPISKADVDRIRDDRARGRDGAYAMTIEEALTLGGRLKLGSVQRIFALRRMFVLGGFEREFGPVPKPE